MNKAAIFLLLAAVTTPLFAQDFGFGFDNEAASGGGSSFSVSVGGKASASMTGFFDDFSEGAEHIKLGDIFSGKLNFSAKTAIGEGVINLNLQPTALPVNIDEAYLRAYFGNFEIAAGLRKLTWGKADSFGPLDVINPLDSSQIYTEMADNASLMGVKIARPLVHASFRFGQFSKIEGVFIPNFEPYYIASEGRWEPAQMKMMKNPAMPMPASIPIPVNASVITTETEPDTTALDYAQGGLRFTTTVGPADFGVQYYYGRLAQPAAKISLTDFKLDMTAIPQSVGVEAEMNILYKYNPYHQIGLDYAQVLAGFNIRAEVAANITEDLKGDDGSVYNPSIAWSFGFDRDLFLGVNLNLQVNESIRLMHDKLGSKDISLPSDIINVANLATIEEDMKNTISVSVDNIDTEGGSELTATRLTAIVSKKFLRDELELRTAVVWGIEDFDCLIMPALIWTKDDIRIALAGGFFAGDSEGQLGQYKDNNFLKVSLTYSF